MKTGKNVKLRAHARKSLHKANKKEHIAPSGFSVIFTSALGGGSIGSFFGVPGVLVGAALGGGIGAFMKRENA